MSTAARLEADEHPARCQHVTVRAVRRRLDDPRTGRGADQIADARKSSGKRSAPNLLRSDEFTKYVALQ
jgi:hypothetical protein